MANLTLNDIKDVESDWSKLFTRMKNDRKLYFLEKYVLKDMKNQKLDDVHSTTLNLPKVYAERVISVLSETPLRWVVKGIGLKDKDASKIERFFDLMILSANKYLENQGQPALQVKAAEQLAIRGRLGFRCMLRMDGETFLPDIKCLDMLYCVYAHDGFGLEWIAPNYTLRRAQLLSEYPDAERFIKTGLKKFLIRDVWDRETETVYADDVKIIEQENPYKKVPFVVKVCDTGSFLDDKEAIEFWGESIYSSNRDLYDELNLLVSVMQTHNKISLYPPQKAKMLGNREIKSHGYKMGGVTNLKSGEDIDTLKGLDINNSVRMAHGLISRSIDQGSLPAVDYGNLGFTLSAVAIEKLSEPAKQVYLPRLRTMSSAYEQLGRMMAEQYLAQNFKADLGEEGFTETIDAAILDNKYQLKADLHLKLPEEEMANYSMAAGAGNLISEDTKRRDILKLQNPEEEDDKIKSEQAEQLSPTLMLYRRAKSLINKSKLTGDKQLEMEAKILLAEIGMNLESIEKGVGSPKPLQGKMPDRPQTPQTGAALPNLGVGSGGAHPPGSRQSNTPGMESATLPTGEEE
jgi:hypothetical protein